jgi:predicted PurR-regulated permease PerM
MREQTLFTGWTPARRNRALLVVALMLLLVLVLRAASGALFPYILALVIAYLMLPPVNWLERNLRRHARFGKAARPVAILLVYVLGAGLVVFFFSMVVPIIVDQFRSLWANREALGARLQDLTIQGSTWYRQNLSEQVRVQVENNLRQASGTIIDTVQAGVMRTMTVVTTTVSFVLGMTVIPFWLFYVLYDRAKMVTAAHKMIPVGLWADFRNLVRLTDNILGAYIRGQIFLSVAIGVMATAGLMLLGVQFPVLLGLMAALFEFLPFIGPILGAIPAVIVATIQQPILGLWTVFLFMGIQQVEGSFLAPRIAGDATRLHPAIIMVVLVVGNEVAGLWGMLVAVPVAAIIRDCFRYMYLRFQDDPVPPQQAFERVKTGT